LTEPPDIYSYDLDFLDTFDFVAGPKFSYLSDRESFIVSNPIIPFFVGVELPVESKFESMARRIHYFKKSRKLPIVKFSVSELMQIDMRKTKSLSVIISSKKMTQQQIDRINFVQYLERNSRIPIKIFGGLAKPIRDKFTILSSSTHHIAIENSSHRDYWTEKFADSLLSLNHTFYCGAPNLSSYFDESIFDAISLSSFKESKAIIEDTFFNKLVDLDKLKSERAKLLHENSLLGLIRKVQERL
jgi:hypothetical protein